MAQVYLIVSSDVKWVGQKRESLVQELVPDYLRDENLTEIYQSGARALKLDAILEDVLGELSTLPMLPDSRRVIVVHNLVDFFGGRGAGEGAAPKKGEKKRTPLDVFKSFVTQDLPSTSNALIFSNIIDHMKGQYLDAKSPLLKFIEESPVCAVLKPPRNEQDPLWLMGDALMERNALGCLRHFRAIYSDDNRSRIFREMLRIVRFLLQAKVVAKKQQDVIEACMPMDKSVNLLMQASFVQGKINRNVERFQVRELMLAMDRLLEINSYLFPSARMKYVPDAQFLFETFIMEFCAGQLTSPRTI
jgi:hypothetical protein